MRKGFFHFKSMISSVKKERRTLLLLFVLALYIVVQVFWWGFSLIQIHAQTIHSKIELNDESKTHLVNNKIWMIVGEGGVFLFLLLVGFWYIKRTITKELQVSRMEKTFLLSVTHELKTPVAAIKLFLETMKSRNLNEEQKQVIISDALSETERLQNLNENILLATRFDHNKGEPLNEKVRISDLISKLAVRIQTLTGRFFQLDIEPNLQLVGDEELLKAMCSNLIENAIKYSTSETTIRISLEKKGNEIILRFADNGIGISDEEKERVFEKFYRSGDEQTRKHKGTGLGLYIVHNVIRLHKAKISIKDNELTGAIFIVTFSKQ